MCLKPKETCQTEDVVINDNIFSIEDNRYHQDYCDYIDYDDVSNVKCSHKDLSIINLNIRGLYSKQIELTKLLKQSLGPNKVDIVILQETWLTGHNNHNIKIPGYKYEGRIHPSKKGGGVGILLSTELRYKIRADLLHNGDVMEHLAIEVETKQSNIIINSIYRPPGCDATCFNREFSSMIQKQSQEKRKEIIYGLDHNMDFLKSDKHNATQDFLDTILKNGLIPTITRPTRVTKSTATLIDNVLLSQKLATNYNSGVVCHDISDHFPCLVIVKQVNCSKKEPLTITSRQLNEKNISLINHELENTDWHTISKAESVSDKFELFHSKIMQVSN